MSNDVILGHNEVTVTCHDVYLTPGRLSGLMQSAKTLPKSPKVLFGKRLNWRFLSNAREQRRTTEINTYLEKSDTYLCTEDLSVLNSWCRPQKHEQRQKTWWCSPGESLTSRVYREREGEILCACASQMRRVRKAHSGMGGTWRRTESDVATKPGLPGLPLLRQCFWSCWKDKRKK